MAKINVQGKDIALKSVNDNDYISLTDIARFKDTTRTEVLPKIQTGVIDTL